MNLTDIWIAFNNYGFKPASSGLAGYSGSEGHTFEATSRMWLVGP